MEHSIGVGAIVGLITASSLYVWNSNEFTKGQKTFLLIAMVFAPVQWIGILVITYYNNYKKDNSIENVTERKVEQVKSNLDNSISNLKELKNKGILTDEEFKTKVCKIEAEKKEQSLKNSLEYKQLQSLFDNGILTKEEFDNKIHLLHNVSGNAVDKKEINKILDSINRTYIDSKEIKQNSKKESSTPIYIGSILFFAFLIGGLILNYYTEDNSVLPADSSTTFNDYPAADTLTTYNKSAPNQESSNEKMNLFTVSEIAKSQSITLFSNICGIYPGETSLNDVKLILGEPDFIDITKTEFTEGRFSGGNKIVKYKSLGIELLFEREDIHLSAVNQILVKESFNAKSAEGIYIGMPENECLNILNNRYFLDLEIDDDFKSYKKKEGGISSLTIWLKDGKLDKLAMD